VWCALTAFAGALYVRHSMFHAGASFYGLLTSASCFVKTLMESQSSEVRSIEN
jgi:hypothetical protein